MTNEVKIRRKRFLAFCLALALVCCQLVPITADAADYSADDTLTGKTLYAGDTLTSTETDGSASTYSVYYEDPDWAILYTDTASFGSPYVVLDYSNGTLQSPALPDGCSFKGWEVREIYASSGVLYSVSLRARLESQITYELDGGTNGSNPTSYSYDSGVASFADATKPGYTFGGWYSDAAFTTEVTSIAAGKLGGITLYAKFIQNSSYQITYELDGGSIEGTYPTSYVEGIGAELKDAAKEGYTFDGWYSDGGFTTQVTSISTTQTGDMTLYAKFTANSYTITYVLNGGTNGSNPTGYTYGTGVASFADATKAGCSFDGWYSDAGFTARVTSVVATQTGDLTLYAKFTGNDYTITYVLNGGTNGDNPTGYVFGIGVASFAAASKDGYKFVAWYVDAAFTTEITSIPADQTGNLTLYAKFVPYQYNIGYELDGGTNGSNPTGYFYGTGVACLKDAEKDGYVFEGWYLDEDFTVKVESIRPSQRGYITLYAKFRLYRIGKGTFYLEAGVQYRLGSEVRQVVGDSSTYGEEVTFYVPKSGYYQFD